MKEKDTNVAICNSANLTIKEDRGSSTMYSTKSDFVEVTKNTKTYFNWMMTTVASKIKIEDLNAENRKKQEVYYVVFKSEGYDYRHVGFKTREGAIKNALEFAKRNGIDIDGYSLSS